MLHKRIDPMSLLVDPSAYLVIDLLQHASKLNNSDIADMLIQPEIGIYLKGGLKPLVRYGGIYYPESKYLNPTHVFTTLEAMLLCKENIIDETGRIVLSYNVLKNPSRLTTNPEIPLVGVELTRTVAINYIDTICPHTRSIANKNIYKYIQPCYQPTINLDQLDSIFADMLYEIHTFIDSDTWFIYFDRVCGSSLIIEKMVDWRIFKYHEMIYQSEHE